MNRSRGENRLAELLIAHGMTVRQSVWDLVEGYEIDIFLPDFNTGISFDGPVHRLPIYGEKRLAQVQRRDAYRNRKLAEMGVRHIVVQDVRQFSEYKTASQFRSCLAALSMPSLFS
jgi:hypothetical protein